MTSFVSTSRRARLAAPLLLLAGLAGCPSAPPAGPDPGAPTVGALFTEIQDEVGLAFTHGPWSEDYYFMPEMTAPGAALFDADGDGDLDCYIVNSAYGPGFPGEQAPDGAPPNQFFRQEADGSFVNATEGSGLDHRGYGIGVAIGDYDDDGRPDVYLTCLEADALLRNRGDGTFEDVTARAGIDNPAWSCSATFFDADRDGDLDLYVANYVKVAADKSCSDASGQRDFCGPAAFPGVRDTLYMNNGDGTFTDVSEAAGIHERTGKGLGVVARDFDGDGWPDLYVANDGEPNQLWINGRDGTFEDVAYARGTAVNDGGIPEASMGIAVGDVDADGDPDLFMTHLAGETNTFYLNEGNGFFRDDTTRASLGPMSRSFTGFGTMFLDVEHDGDLDLLIANGRVKRGSVPQAGGNMGPFWNQYAESNQYFRNLGNARFEEASVDAGLLTSRVEVSRGLAVGDIDGDGDMDVLLTNCKGPARLYRNDAPKAGPWLRVFVREDSGRDAFGASVEITTAAGRQIHGIHADGSYASSSEPVAHFGLGADDRIETLRVVWPDGAERTFTDVAPDRTLIITRDGNPIDAAD